MRFGLVAAVLVLFAETRAHRPLRPEAFAQGLDAQGTRAPASGRVVALRAPGPTWVRIAGGAFLMGSTPNERDSALQACRHEILSLGCNEQDTIGVTPLVASFRSELPAHPVVVSAFQIQRTEVSVAAYARCVAAGGCAPPGYVAGDPHFDRPELPVTSVRWDDAAAYCTWAGARLPTEAEWELAARGTARRTYPWGENFNPHIANHGALAPDPTDATDGYLGPAPVEAFRDGATPEGVLNLAGNVAEWVSDYYDTDDEGYGYPAKMLPPTGGPSHNPTGSTSGLAHVVRGGSYLQGAAWLRGAARAILVVPRAPSVGFRCARGAGA